MKASSSNASRVPWASLAAMPLLFAARSRCCNRASMRRRSDFASAARRAPSASPNAIKKLSLGYDSLLADIYWTRAVQYYGSRLTVHSRDFDLLWPLLDVTTTLDPKLIVAYRFGAIFLSEPAGRREPHGPRGRAGEAGHRGQPGRMASRTRSRLPLLLATERLSRCRRRVPGRKQEAGCTHLDGRDGGAYIDARGIDRDLARDLVRNI